MWIWGSGRELVDNVKGVLVETSGIRVLGFGLLAWLEIDSNCGANNWKKRVPTMNGGCSLCSYWLCFPSSALNQWSYWSQKCCFFFPFWVLLGPKAQKNEALHYGPKIYIRRDLSLNIRNSCVTIISTTRMLRIHSYIRSMKY